MGSSGKKIVLAASDSESSEYLRSTWRQMLLACLPQRYAKYLGVDWSMEHEVTPEGQARYVPHGLRIIESLLLQKFSPEDIAVCYPDQLDLFVGDDTRVVEITRGCGRGCQFCSVALRRGKSIPLEHILDNVRVQVTEGADTILLTTEDLFLYEQGPRFDVNLPALKRLFESVMAVPGVKYIMLTHGTLAPIVLKPEIIEELSPIAVGRSVSQHPASHAPRKSICQLFYGHRNCVAPLVRNAHERERLSLPPPAMAGCGSQGNANSQQTQLVSVQHVDHRTAR